MEKISLGHYHHQLAYDAIVDKNYIIIIPDDADKLVFTRQIRSGVKKSNKILNTNFTVKKVDNVLHIVNKKPLTPERIFFNSVKGSGDIYVPRTYDFRKVVKLFKSSRKKIKHISYLERMITLNKKQC